MAPIQSSLEHDVPGMGDFIYKDLYKSEKYFFIKLLRNVNSFLDIGCAGGGFFKIIRKFKKSKRNYGAVL